MKFEVNQKKKFGKTSNTWRLKNILLKKNGLTRKLKKNFKKCREANENENMTVQNLWDMAKVVMRGKITATHAFLKKQEKSWSTWVTQSVKHPTSAHVMISLFLPL